MVIGTLRHRLVWFAVAMLAAANLPSCASAATQRALLVGVSEYDQPGLTLYGPGNDVALMRDVLSRIGFPTGSIVTLASGLDAAHRPTRANILAELDRLAQVSEPGDLVYLHVSGHGSQEPAGEGSSKGRDLQVFLPEDAGVWDETRGTIANVIPDWRWAEALTRIRNRGARVWAVFDTCHAGTMGRRSIAPVRERVRAVSSAALGVPPGAAGRPLPPKLAVRPGAGELVAFYAVQPEELASEREFDSLSPPRTYGVFTWRLAGALLANPGASFRQLSQHLLAEYGASNEQRTPLFEGPLDHSIMSREPQALLQWPLGRRDDGGLEVPAGALNGLKPGMQLLLLPNAAAADAAVIGVAEVSTVGAVVASLTPVAAEGLPAVRPLTLPPRAFARLTQVEPGFDLQAALPDGPGHSPAERRLVAALQRLQASPGSLPRIKLVPSGSPAEVRLATGDGRLWLTPADSGRSTPSRGAMPSIPADGTDAELEQRIERMLASAARAHGLLRAMALLAEPGEIGTDGPDLHVKLTLVPAQAAQIDCTPGDAAFGTELDPLTIPPLRHCDQVIAEFSNGGTQPLDVTLLYMDSTYGIAPLFPQRGHTNRIEPGRTSPPVTIELQAVEQDGSASTVGRERLLVIAVVARSGSERADFTWLAQDSTRGLPRPQFGLPGLLGQSMALTRAARIRPEPPRQAVGMMVSWDLQPFSP